MIWDIVAKVMVNEQKDVEPLTVTENGTYSEEGKAYSPVTVNVPTAVMDTLNVTENGTYTPQSGHAYNEVNVNVQSGGGDDLFKKMIQDTEDYSITLADLQGITHLKNSSFNACTHLKSIELPDSFTTLPIALFNGCTGLVSVKLPSALTEIPNHAFNSCTTLPFLDIPASVQKIGLNGCFASCNRLRTIICRAVTPPQVGGTTLQGMPSDCKIYVPDESVEAYKTAQFWSVRADYIKPLSEYTPS